MGQSPMSGTRVEDEQFIPCPLLLPQPILLTVMDGSSSGNGIMRIQINAFESTENGVNAAKCPFTA